MNISYKDPALRDYCYTLNVEFGKTPFSPVEIRAIRAIIADLRAAPRLSDAPIDFDFNESIHGRSRFSILFEKIKIIFEPISASSNPSITQIGRIQILEIVRIDLQLEDSQTF